MENEELCPTPLGMVSVGIVSKTICWGVLGLPQIYVQSLKMAHIQLQGQLMTLNSQISICEEIGSQNPEEPLNPSTMESQCEIRCRFCYENSKPLISVCACTGSIQYVHEQCILNWIQKKLEISQALEIPCCEICQQKFSARMRIGRKKLSLDLLTLRLKSTSKKEIGQGILHVLMVLACILTILFSMNTLYHDLSPWATGFQPGLTSARERRSGFQVLGFVFTNIVVEVYGILHFTHFLRSKRKWVQDSMIQIVEVILQPKYIRQY